MDENHPGVSNGNLPEDPKRPKRGRPRADGERHRDQCEGCGVHKDPSEFSKFMALDIDSDVASPFLCNYCATYGPPLEDPLARLGVKERQAILALSTGASVPAAAKIMGVSRERLRDILSGQEKHIMRGAFQRLLVSEGLGPDEIASALKRSLEGKKYQWNPKEEQFQEFQDLAAQGRAVETLIKILDLKPPQELARNADPKGSHQTQINVYTNVGDGKEAKPNEYEVRATVIEGDS